MTKMIAVLFFMVIAGIGSLYWFYPFIEPEVTSNKELKAVEERLLEYITTHKDEFVYTYSEGHTFQNKNITFIERIRGQKYFINDLQLSAELGKKIESIMWKAKIVRDEQVSLENLKKILTVIEEKK